MSSEPFAVQIRPDRCARRWVILSGYALAVVGTGLLASVDLPGLARAGLGGLWLARCGFQLRQQRRVAAVVARIRLDANGGLTVADAGGRVRTARLVTGSTMFERLAWLRLRIPGLGGYGELLRAASLGAADWHRLRLILRQSNARFGPAGPT